jgi:NAD(P)-dependent dehydrogenase (short-subunit alcohol dehydrogenase family)
MATDWFDLSGKVAVVTGSTKGIGLSMSRAMAEHGAKVVISSRKADLCDEIAKSFTDDGLEAIAIPCNVSHLDQIENLLARTRDTWGKIDILICNAAVNPHYGSALDIPEDMFDKTMDVNIKSNLWLCQGVIPEMQERKDGVIIITSSVGGLRGNTVIGAYCITKAADMQLARNLAVEFGKDNIRVNCVAPGLVKTNFARALYENPEVAREREAATPLRRLGEPDDVGGIAVYLASRAGNWTTGQTICVDGGVTAAAP